MSLPLNGGRFPKMWSAQGIHSARRPSAIFLGGASGGAGAMVDSGHGVAAESKAPEDGDRVTATVAFVLLAVPLGDLVVGSLTARSAVRSGDCTSATSASARMSASSS